jgi:hypothetical protein
MNRSATSLRPSEVSPRSSASLFRRALQALAGLAGGFHHSFSRFLGGILELLVRAAQCSILDLGRGEQRGDRGARRQAGDCHRQGLLAQHAPPGYDIRVCRQRLALLMCSNASAFSLPSMNSAR